MSRAIKILFSAVAGTHAVVAIGYWVMAADGYDYWSPFFPDPGSSAETGMTIVDVGMIVVPVLTLAAWIVFSVFIVQAQRSIPTAFKHSTAGVWLWWLVPVAYFWKPRDVVLELAAATRPGDLAEVRRIVNRWWLAFVGYQVVNFLGWLELGPIYLALAATAVAVASGTAARLAGPVVDVIATPEVTYETAMANIEMAPVVGVEPTAPGWYNDPAGVSAHQAYWDGGRWTGATRPDPRHFPGFPASAPAEPDRLRKWLIVFGVVFTAAVVAWVIAMVVIALMDAGFGAGSILA